MSKIAAVQMVSSCSVRDNLAHVEACFQQAREKHIDMLVLPENFAFMGLNEKDKLALAEVNGSGEIQDKLALWSKTYGIWVVAGTIAIKATSQHVRSSCLVYDDKGHCAARYDKIHLFDVRVSEQEAHQESATIERGTELVVVDTPVGCIGLTVCYDLRFPELFHALQQRGAELFTVPSAFTEVTGAAHWEVLLRARAIENLAYVIAPNQGGLHENGRQTHGHSMIIEPWGKILAQSGKEQDMISADIDLIRLRQLRRQFPCNDHHVL